MGYDHLPPDLAEMVREVNASGALSEDLRVRDRRPRSFVDAVINAEESQKVYKYVSMGEVRDG